MTPTSRFAAAALAVTAMLLNGPVQAAGAPEGLRNKTVVMTWTTSGSARRDDGFVRTYNNVNTRTVFVSSQGRPFLRMQLKGGKASREASLAPGESGPNGGNVSIQGNRVVIIEAFQSGARQVVATLDASFSSCTLSIIDAKSGSANIRRKGPDGAMYEITSVSTGSPTCSIQSGNAFAH